MKVKIFDTCFSNPSDPNDPTVNVYFELTKELTRLQKEEKAVIKAVKLIFTYPDGFAAIFAIYYERPAVIKQKTFKSINEVSDSEINNFMKSHNVIRVEHFNGNDYDTVTTVITYKEHEND